MAAVIHHRFTVDEYEQMILRGILTENERVELIRGEVVEKTIIGPSHIACVNRLNSLLVQRLSEMAIVSVQNPIMLSDSEPEPDIALLVPRTDFYAHAKPKGSDVTLVVEVADSSLAYDREIKLPLYAQACIQEFWIVNLEAAQVEVFRKPTPNGSYEFHANYARGDSVKLLAYPQIDLPIDSILG